MSRVRSWVLLGGLAGLVLFAAPRSPSQTRERPAAPAPSQAPTPIPPPTPTSQLPRLVPVAETKLLMDGINKPNFDGLTKVLKAKPADAEAWSFARGQSLLIAETANLLLIRPPKTRTAQQAWVPRAVELRQAGVRLAEAAGAKDYVGARAALADLTNACNRCHESFRVPVRLDPAAPE